MRNNNRKSQKPAARYNETVIDNQFDVRLLNTWEAVSLIVFLGEAERMAMSRTFRFTMVDIDVNIKHILMCVDTGRAMDQRYRRDRGVQIDIELKKAPDGIIMMLHLVTLFTDDGYPRYEMPARDDEGKFRMVDGKQVMVPATLTIERFFPENRLQKLYDTVEDLSAAMMLRRIRRNLRARGDRKSFAELHRTMENFLNLSEQVPVERLTANLGEISSKGGQRPAKIGKPKDKIKPAKAEVAPAETAPAVPAKPTPDEESDDLARKLTIATIGIDPDASLPTDAEGNPPEPAASASPTPASKPKKVKPRSVKLGSPEAKAKLEEMSASSPSTPSNGQS